MGSKKKAKQKKHRGQTSHKSTALRKLTTPFMGAFTRQFIGGLTKKKQKFFVQGTSEVEVFQNVATVMTVLAEQSTILGKPVSGGSSSLRDQVIDFLNAQGWPDHTAVPKEFKGKDGEPGEERMVHLIEMAVIADRLLHAINLGFGGSGGPTSWPPHG